LFHIHIDHKPLVPIFSTKILDELPLRVQHFCLDFSSRFLTFQANKLIPADTLSYAPLSHLGDTDHNRQQDCDTYLALAVEIFPTPEARLLENVVKSCHICSKFCSAPTEPMISTPFSQLPWQKVGVDLFTWKKAKYLLVFGFW